jgi:hypothetical protein
VLILKFVSELVSEPVSELLFRHYLCNILASKLVLLSQLHRSPYFSSLVEKLVLLSQLHRSPYFSSLVERLIASLSSLFHPVDI